MSRVKLMKGLVVPFGGEENLRKLTKNCKNWPIFPHKLQNPGLDFHLLGGRTQLVGKTLRQTLKILDDKPVKRKRSEISPFFYKILSSSGLALSPLIPAADATDLACLPSLGINRNTVIKFGQVPQPYSEIPLSYSLYRVRFFEVHLSDIKFFLKYT